MIRLFLSVCFVVALSSCGRIIITNDGTSPTIVSRSPSSGEVNVAVNSAVTVRFSEHMDAITLTPSTFKLSGNLPGTVTYNSSTLEAAFAPDQNFSPNTAYTVTLTSDVTDRAGNRLTASSWSFRTAP